LTIVISVALSVFNAMSLSPALAARLLRPKKSAASDGAAPRPSWSHPLQRFYAAFNRAFDGARTGYLRVSSALVHRKAVAVPALALIALAAVFLAKRLPTAFLPEEDQGYMFVTAQLPPAASLDRTGKVCEQIEQILKDMPGVRTYTTVRASAS
jgi:hydrophobic/amphiphilic exporter-1 (mainly G- bacteria), HAE1 family